MWLGIRHLKAIAPQQLKITVRFSSPRPPLDDALNVYVLCFKYGLVGLTKW